MTRCTNAMYFFKFYFKRTCFQAIWTFVHRRQFTALVVQVMAISSYRFYCIYRSDTDSTTMTLAAIPIYLYMKNKKLHLDTNDIVYYPYTRVIIIILCNNCEEKLYRYIWGTRRCSVEKKW